VQTLLKFPLVVARDARQFFFETTPPSTAQDCCHHHCDCCHLSMLAATSAGFAPVSYHCCCCERCSPQAHRPDSSEAVTWAVEHHVGAAAAAAGRTEMRVLGRRACSISTPSSRDLIAIGACIKLSCWPTQSVPAWTPPLPPCASRHGFRFPPQSPDALAGALGAATGSAVASELNPNVGTQGGVCTWGTKGYG